MKVEFAGDQVVITCSLEDARELSNSNHDQYRYWMRERRDKGLENNAIIDKHIEQLERIDKAFKVLIGRVEY